MNKTIYLYTLLAFFLATASGSARELVDSTFHKSVVMDRPSRVVTLAPSLGELVADFDEDMSRIVAVSEYTDYPPGLKKKPSIGPYSQVNLERILSFRPDLVLATLDGNPKDSIIHLRELGVPVVVVSTQNFSEIEDSIKMVALALGEVDRGNQMIQQFKLGLDRIRKKGQVDGKARRLRVMIQVGDDPLIVAGKKSFLNEALQAVGATNIYADAEAHYPRPSLEDVVTRDPDVIIVAALGEDARTYQQTALRWHQFKALSAVKRHKVRVLRSDALLRPSLRLLEGLSQLGKCIYE